MVTTVARVAHVASEGRLFQGLLHNSSGFSPRPPAPCSVAVVHFEVVWTGYGPSCRLGKPRSPYVSIPYAVWGHCRRSRVFQHWRISMIHGWRTLRAGMMQAKVVGVAYYCNLLLACSHLTNDNVLLSRRSHGSYS